MLNKSTVWRTLTSERHAEARAYPAVDMHVTARVVGEESHTLNLEKEATYADLLRALDFSPHEASVLVDGTPVPEDARITHAEVEVLRLVKGG